jgi:hypothetical protein
MADKNRKGSKGGSGASRGSSGSSADKGRSRGSRDSRAEGSKKQYSATTRDVERQRQHERAETRRDLKGAAVNLPNWIVEEVSRTTPGDRIGPTLEALGAASEALGDGNYQSAVKHGQRAKALSPQSATIRETIGIAAYRVGDWSTALKELRAYRRMAGETTHLPIEMDVLRAQGRTKDVELAWKELEKRGGHGLVMNEGKIVYASHLLDQGRPDEAWKIVKPPRMEQRPNEGHLRLYYVAARTAAARGDKVTARKWSDEIITHDPSFPGYEQLEREIAAIS